MCSSAKKSAKLQLINQVSLPICVISADLVGEGGSGLYLQTQIKGGGCYEGVPPSDGSIQACNGGELGRRFCCSGRQGLSLGIPYWPKYKW